MASTTPDQKILRKTGISKKKKKKKKKKTKKKKKKKKKMIFFTPKWNFFTIPEKFFV